MKKGKNKENAKALKKKIKRQLKQIGLTNQPTQATLAKVKKLHNTYYISFILYLYATCPKVFKFVLSF